MSGPSPHSSSLAATGHRAAFRRRLAAAVTRNASVPEVCEKAVELHCDLVDELQAKNEALVQLLLQNVSNTSQKPTNEAQSSLTSSRT
jgi:hypothetical protein